MQSMQGVTSLTLGAGAVVLSGLIGGLFGGQVLAVQEGLPAHYESFAAALAALRSAFMARL